MKRYDVFAVVDENCNGDYVLHSDHEAALAEAVKKEREACAQVADRRVMQSYFEIAAAIRARSDK
jgi:hypothetical protein